MIRKVLRQTFIVCRDKSWDIEWVTKISNVFEELILNPKTNLGFNLYVTEIYLEELGKVPHNLGEIQILVGKLFKFL